jgi:radical SAM enzyme (rSAM/lipoprotein system)
MVQNKMNLQKKLGLELFRSYKKSQTQLHDLKYLFWECTLKCNFSCLHCGSNCGIENSNDLPYQLIVNELAIIKKMLGNKLPHIVITGGEPLIRKDIEMFGSEISKLGYNWGLVTNGFLLDIERLTNLIKSGLTAITISLDGLKDSHNWLRNNVLSFDRTINAIELVSKENNLTFDVATCITTKNLYELDKIHDLLTGLDVKNWRLFTIDPIGRASKHKELNINEKDFVHTLEFIKNAKKRKGININFGCDGFLENYEGVVREEFYFCRAGINIASVLHDGSICACPNISRKLIQGNILHESLIDVWNNKYQLFRNRDWTKSNQCAKCKNYKYCLGNGICLRDIENNKVIRCHSKMLNNVTSVVS